ncbi:MAG: hypothetical protein JW889_03955 [Verrucomicrobia bacterium]|nr:hypothetical protein [Verrucomicrobiota bacterium]
MFKLICLFPMVVVLAMSAAFAAEPAANGDEAPGDAEQPVVEEKPMTQAELAVIIVRMLGLESEIDRSIGGKATFDVRPDIWYMAHINFLRRMGIYPLPDWDPNAEVTKEVLAVVLVQLLGLLGEVEDLNVPGDYVAALEARDIELTNVRDVLSEIDIINPVVQIPIGGMFQDNLSTTRGR